MSIAEPRISAPLGRRDFKKDNEPYSWETYSPKDGGTKKSEYIPFLLMWALSWGYSLAYMPTEAGSNFVIISAMLYWGTKLPLQHMNR